MALTRAQLLMGDASQGTVLTSQVQGVKQGTGVIISSDGTISLDLNTITGLVKLNNPLAYNGYVWPNSFGTAGQVLQGDGFGNLTWVTTAGTPGLGINITGGITKVSIPVASLPPAPGALATESIDGSLYWDDTLGLLFIRYNDGSSTQWVQVTPSGGGGGGGGSTYTGTAPIVVTGTVISINAATAVAAGAIEIATLAEAAAGVDADRAMTPSTAVPKDAAGMAGAALLPGSAAVYSGTVATGMIRYNNATPPAVIEYYNGSAWVTLGGAPAATLAEAAAGTLNTKYLSPETGIAKDASGVTGAALLPAGTTAVRPATPVTGMTRYNSTIGTLEVYNGTTWIALTTAGSGADPYGWFGHSASPG